MVLSGSAGAPPEREERGWLGLGYSNDNRPLTTHSPLQRNVVPQDEEEGDKSEDAVTSSLEGSALFKAANDSIQGKSVTARGLQDMGYAYRKALALERHKRRQAQAQLNRKKQQQQQQQQSGPGLHHRSQQQQQGESSADAHKKKERHQDEWKVKDPCNPDPSLIARKLRYARLPPRVRGHLYATLLSLVIVRRKAEFAGKLKAFLVLKRRMERKVDPGEYSRIQKALRVLTVRSEILDYERKRWAMQRLARKPIMYANKVLENQYIRGLKLICRAHTSAAFRKWMVAAGGPKAIAELCQADRLGVQPDVMMTKLLELARSWAKRQSKSALTCWVAFSASMSASHQTRLFCTFEMLNRSISRRLCLEESLAKRDAFTMWFRYARGREMRAKTCQYLVMFLARTYTSNSSKRMTRAFASWRLLCQAQVHKEVRASLERDAENRHITQESLSNKRLDALSSLAIKIRERNLATASFLTFRHNARLMKQQRGLVQGVIKKWIMRRQASAFSTLKGYCQTTRRCIFLIRAWQSRKLTVTQREAFRVWIQHVKCHKKMESACRILYRLLYRHTRHILYVSMLKLKFKRAAECGRLLPEPFKPTGERQQIYDGSWLEERSSREIPHVILGEKITKYPPSPIRVEDVSEVGCTDANFARSQGIGLGLDSAWSCTEGLEVDENISDRAPPPSRESDSDTVGYRGERSLSSNAAEPNTPFGSLSARTLPYGARNLRDSPPRMGGMDQQHTLRGRTSYPQYSTVKAKAVERQSACDPDYFLPEERGGECLKSKSNHGTPGIEVRDGEFEIQNETRLCRSAFHEGPLGSQLQDPPRTLSPLSDLDCTCGEKNGACRSQAESFRLRHHTSKAKCEKPLGNAKSYSNTNCATSKSRLRHRNSSLRNLSPRAVDDDLHDLCGERGTHGTDESSPVLHHHHDHRSSEIKCGISKSWLEEVDDELATVSSAKLSVNNTASTRIHAHDHIHDERCSCSSCQRVARSRAQREEGRIPPARLLAHAADAPLPDMFLHWLRAAVWGEIPVFFGEASEIKIHLRHALERLKLLQLQSLLTVKEVENANQRPCTDLSSPLNVSLSRLIREAEAVATADCGCWN